MNTQAMATLINQLQAPLIVSDILTGKDKHEDTNHALSSLISDMQPDAAILSIALSMRKIIAPYLSASPSLQVTEIECARLTEDYIQSWTTNPINETSDPHICMDILKDAIEDLDYLEELLDLNMNFLKAKDICAMELCHLLKSQTQAQKIIAEQYLQTLDLSLSQNNIASMLQTPTFTNIKTNIINFPNRV